MDLFLTLDTKHTRTTIYKYFQLDFYPLCCVVIFQLGIAYLIFMKYHDPCVKLNPPLKYNHRQIPFVLLLNAHF